MLFRSNIFLEIVVVIFCITQTTYAVTKTRHLQLSDPVFGIKYNPDIIHFDIVPNDVKNICGGYNNRNWSLYSHFEFDDSNYYIVMGWDSYPLGDSFGTAVWIKNNKCREVESSWILTGVPEKSGYRKNIGNDTLPGIDEPTPEVCNSDPYARCNYQIKSQSAENILTGIVRDAIERGIKAFGGKGNFKKKVCTNINMNISYPIVHEELLKFCSIQ